MYLLSRSGMGFHWSGGSVEPVNVAQIVGVLVMEDEGGGDEKIIAVPSSKLTTRYEKIGNYTDLPNISVSALFLAL